MINYLIFFILNFFLNLVFVFIIFSKFFILKKIFIECLIFFSFFIINFLYYNFFFFIIYIFFFHNKFIWDYCKFYILIQKFFFNLLAVNFRLVDLLLILYIYIFNLFIIIWSFIVYINLNNFIINYLIFFFFFFIFSYFYFFFVFMQNKFYFNELFSKIVNLNFFYLQFMIINNLYNFILFLFIPSKIINLIFLNYFYLKKYISIKNLINFYYYIFFDIYFFFCVDFINIFLKFHRNYDNFFFFISYIFGYLLCNSYNSIFDILKIFNKDFEFYDLLNWQKKFDNLNFVEENKDVVFHLLLFFFSFIKNIADFVVNKVTIVQIIFFFKKLQDMNNLKLNLIKNTINLDLIYDFYFLFFILLFLFFKIYQGLYINNIYFYNINYYLDKKNMLYLLQNNINNYILNNKFLKIANTEVFNLLVEVSKYNKYKYLNIEKNSLLDDSSNLFYIYYYCFNFKYLLFTIFFSFNNYIKVIKYFYYLILRNFDNNINNYSIDKLIGLYIFLYKFSLKEERLIIISLIQLFNKFGGIYFFDEFIKKYKFLEKKKLYIFFFFLDYFIKNKKNYYNKFNKKSIFENIFFFLLKIDSNYYYKVNYIKNNFFLVKYNLVNNKILKKSELIKILNNELIKFFNFIFFKSKNLFFFSDLEYIRAVIYIKNIKYIILFFFNMDLILIPDKCNESDLFFNVFE